MAATWRANAVGACTFGTDWKLEKGQPGEIDKIDFFMWLFLKSKKGRLKKPWCCGVQQQSWHYSVTVLFKPFLKRTVTVFIITLWTVGFLSETSSLVGSGGAKAVTLEKNMISIKEGVKNGYFTVRLTIRCFLVFLKSTILHALIRQGNQHTWNLDCGPFWICFWLKSCWW